MAAQLKEAGVPFEYEKDTIPYTQPAKERRYKPDFRLPNGILIETKGIFLTEDRMKHLAIRASRPELDIRFVFSNANKKIGKQSKTTYADWCEAKGFKYAVGTIPSEWITEKKK